MFKKNIIVVVFALMTFTAVHGYCSDNNSSRDSRPAYLGHRYALVLDGEIPVPIRNFQGGHAKGEVATHRLGHGTSKKHITSISFEDGIIEVGMGMSRGLYEWISASMNMGSVRKASFEIHTLDFDLKSASVREFRDATITEVTMPALDASNKDPAYMTIKVRPEEIRYLPGTGEQLFFDLTEEQLWMSNNFKVVIGDLMTERVKEIEGFTWKMIVDESEIGSYRIPTLHATKVEVPNLKLTVSNADFKYWMQWYRSFLLEGNCGDRDEFDGEISFLDRSLRNELGKVVLKNVGIISLEPSHSGADVFTVELYVEHMMFVK